MARGATSILHHAKSVRRQPTFSPLDKSRRVFLFAFLSLVVLASACAIFYIGTHIQAVNLGYKIGQELQRKEQLIEENKRLNLEIARLKSPTRIETEAKETLGLQLPKSQQVFYLSRWEADSLTQVAGASPVAAPAKSAEAKSPAKKPESTKTIATGPNETKAKPATKTAALDAPAEKKLPVPSKASAEEKAKASIKPETKVAAKKPAPAAAAPSTATKSAESPSKEVLLKTAKTEKPKSPIASEKTPEVRPSAKLAAMNPDAGGTPKTAPATDTKPAEAKQGAADKSEVKVAAKKPVSTPQAKTVEPKENTATVAKKTEPAKSEGSKAENKVPAAKSSAKPSSSDTRVAKRESSGVLVAKIVSKDDSREKSTAKPKGASVSSYQPKDKVPAVMLDPMP